MVEVVWPVSAIDKCYIEVLENKSLRNYYRKQIQVVLDVS